MEKPVKLRADLRYLAEIGGDPDQVLAGTGVSFEQIDALVPLPHRQIAELCDTLASRLPQDFAVRCGQASRYQNMGILGYRLQNSSSVRELLEAWSRYSIVIGYPLSSHLIIAGDLWHLTFSSRYGMTPRALRYCMEATIAGLFHAVRAISQLDIQPVGYEFPFAAPDDLSPYAPLAPTPILFGRSAGVVTGRSSDLDLRLAAIDAETKAVCDAYCAQALARISREETAVDRLRSVFARSPGRLPTAGEAAALLKLSMRTLQRQLENEGQSFQQVLAEFRRVQACALLDDGAEPKTIAYLLGFGDVGSFRRAFRSWFGYSPSHWRQLHMR